jgi:hypothetical protein
MAYLPVAVLTMQLCSVCIKKFKAAPCQFIFWYTVWGFGYSAGLYDWGFAILLFYKKSQNRKYAFGLYSRQFYGLIRRAAEPTFNRFFMKYSATLLGLIDQEQNCCVIAKA